MSKRGGDRPTPGSRSGRRRSLVERLEPRILLSADLPLLAPPGEPGAAPQELQLDGETAGQTTELHATRHELVFVDAGVEDQAELLADLRAGSGDNARFDVYVLDDTRDGLTQINEVLAGYDGDLDAVHVVSHGTDAGVQLGATWLTSDSLSERANDVLGWRDAFSKEADLLFYGCDLADSTEGRSLVDQLAVLTGTDVAASTDATGAEALGGNWDLEYTAGSVETRVAFSQGLRASFASVLNGTAIWAEAGSSVPETNDFDGSSFGTETATVDVGGEWRVIAGAEAPTRDEKIVVGVNAAGKIDTMVWDGSTWVDTSPALLDLGTVSDPEEWSFDVAYESQSGDAVFTYNNGFGLIGYSVWDGSTWSIPGAVPQAEAGEACQMKLAANPNSDEMILVVSNEYQEDYAAVWDGSSWGNSIDLHNTGNPVGHTDVSVTYEQQSGHAMLVWGEHDNSVHYSFWDGTSFSAEQTLNPPTGLSGDVVWTSIASDPTTDRIVLGVGTESKETWVAVWDGSAWQAPQAAASNSPHSDRQAVAVAFESGSGQAIAAYTTSSHQIAYQTWNSGGGWSGELVGPDLGDHADALTLDADPSSNTVMLSVVDQAKSVCFVAWDGSSWGTPSQQEADAGTNRGQPFLFLWDQVSAPSVSVSGADTVTAGDVYTLNLSAAAVDVATLSWTIDWGDGTVETIAGNPSSVTHTYMNTGFTNNILVSATDVNGTYIVGDLLSTSFQTDSVMRFDANTGEFLQEFGKNDGDNPVDVQVGPDGRIYVTGYASNNIYRYEADGSGGTEFVTAGSGGLTAASRIAFGPDGNLYVTSMNSNEVLRYSGVDGSPLGAFVSSDLDEPDGITFGHDGDLYVANRGDGEILRFDGQTGVRDVSFLVTSSAGYMDILFGPDGNLWVTNQTSDEIRRYDGVTGADLGVFSSVGASDFAGIAFGPDEHLYMSSAFTVTDKIVRYPIGDGSSPEDFIVKGAEGLDQPVNIVFTPAQQVRVTNAAPTANPDTATVAEGASAVIDLTGNDTDLDDGLDLGSIIVTSGPANGTLVDNGDGTLTYTHDGSETVGDSFSYTIDDVSGATSNVASVAVTVNPQNDAPTAANDSASVNEGASVVINLSGNDTDPDNALDLGSIVITSAPANGTLVDNGDGTLTYTHDGSETVGDSFSYTIDDVLGATSNVAAVTLTINPIYDAPTAVANAAS
ncbi:MAG: DUF4347 domain-containing protein, partial [bacterium]|nr:DUF4347 domain-containing protein [bacterium]